MGKFSSFGAIGSAIAQYISGVVATLLGLPYLLSVEFHFLSRSSLLQLASKKRNT